MGSPTQEGYLSFTFKVSLFLSFALIAAAFSIGASIGTAMPSTEVERLVGEVRKIPATVERIFLNNFFVSLATFLPFVGAAWHLFVQYSTGVVFGSIASQAKVSVIILLLASSPVFVLEYSAYTVALGECLTLSGLVLKRRDAKVRLRDHAWKSVIIVGTVLFVGALVETSIISLIRGP